MRSTILYASLGLLGLSTWACNPLKQKSGLSNADSTPLSLLIENAKETGKYELTFSTDPKVEKIFYDINKVAASEPLTVFKTLGQRRLFKAPPINLMKETELGIQGKDKESAEVSARHVLVTQRESFSSQLQLIDVPVENKESNPNWGPVLSDIMQHQPSEDKQHNQAGWDLVTYGHEVTHGINSILVSRYLKQRVDAFYILDGKGVLMPLPKISRNDIIAFVPGSLVKLFNEKKSINYETYIVIQPYSRPSPLYIFDEWNAYINGAKVALNQAELKKSHDPKRPALSTTFEFVVYGAALGMAVAEKDKTYFAATAQFKAFLAYGIEQAMAILRQGRERKHDFPNESCEVFLNAFLTDQATDVVRMRAFLKTTFGETWTQQTLGY